MDCDTIQCRQPLMKCIIVMLYSFSGQLSVFLLERDVLLYSVVLMYIILLLFKQLNEDDDEYICYASWHFVHMLRLLAFRQHSFYPLESLSPISLFTIARYDSLDPIVRLTP